MISSPTGVSAPRGNISGYKLRSTPNFTPEQMQIFGQLLGNARQGAPGVQQGIGALSDLAAGKESAFAQQEAPAYSAFQRSLGEIGSRYAGVGALGSSAFQNETAGAAGTLAENLQARRSEIQQNALERLLGLSERVLSPRPYETFAERKPDWMKLLTQLGLVGAGAAAGPAGAAFGSYLSSKIG